MMLTLLSDGTRVPLIIILKWSLVRHHPTMYAILQAKLGMNRLSKARNKVAKGGSARLGTGSMNRTWPAILHPVGKHEIENNLSFRGQALKHPLCTISACALQRDRLRENIPLWKVFGHRLWTAGAVVATCRRCRTSKSRATRAVQLLIELRWRQ